MCYPGVNNIRKCLWECYSSAAISVGGGKKNTQIASQRGYDEMRSTVLKTLVITWVSCGVCNRVYGVKMKIVDAVKTYISLDAILTST